MFEWLQLAFHPKQEWEGRKERQCLKEREREREQSVYIVHIGRWMGNFMERSSGFMDKRKDRDWRIRSGTDS